MTVFSLHENKVLKRYARPAGPGTIREGTAGSCYIRKKDGTCSVIILYGPGPFFKQGISLSTETGLPDEPGRHKKSRGTFPGVAG
jgi:hypothetical protein